MREKELVELGMLVWESIKALMESNDDTAVLAVMRKPGEELLLTKTPDGGVAFSWRKKLEAT